MLIFFIIVMLYYIGSLFFSILEKNDKNKNNCNNIKQINGIQYFQYGLELKYFDSSDIEKIQFYLDLLKSNKQNDYDIENIEKLIDKYSQWWKNPTIKAKWTDICNRYYNQLETLLKQCSNENINQYYSNKLKYYGAFYGKNRVDITSIFKMFKHNLIGYIDWENHYKNIQTCINEKKR